MAAGTLYLDHHPDLILYNARVYTVDRALPWAEAIALRGPTIVAVGTNNAIRALATAKTELIDAHRRLILPGLCDAHIHLNEWAVNLARPPLASARSQDEMLAMLGNYAASLPATSWVVCQGWNESWWGQHDFFSAAELDRVTQPGQPCIAFRSDMHIAVANHAALALAGITRATPNPPGGIIDRDAQGEPTGVLRELAIRLVTAHIAAPTAQEMVDNVRQASHELHRLGVTAIHDQRIKDSNEGTLMLSVYETLRAAAQLALRTSCNIAAHNLDHIAALGLHSGFGDDFLRLGHVKVFADGSLGSRTAWMLAPFAPQSPDEQPNYGVNVTPPEQMAAEFRRAQQLGFPISVHAIGDRANRVVLDILEEISGQLPPLAVPHRIEHVQTLDPQDMPRLAQLNVTASVQPIHLTDDRDLTDLFWGTRAAHTYAFRSLHEFGTRLAFGSDAPVADPNPFLGIHAALTRHQPHDGRDPWQPQEALDLATIIHAYTLGAAEAVGWDATIGTITPGKRADLIMLDRDIFALAEDDAARDDIADTQVTMTIVDGEIVYTHPHAA